MPKKVKLPKRIAGVKIPKKVRKGPIGNFLGSSAGQLLIAEALVLAAGAFAVKRTDPDSPAGKTLRHPVAGLKRAGRSAASAENGTREAISRGSAKLAFAFSEAAQAFRQALDKDRTVGAEAGIAAGERAIAEGDLQTASGSSKKKRSSSSQPGASSTPH